MATTASMKRRKPDIGSRRFFAWLSIGVAIYLVGRAIWPSLPDSVQGGARAALLVAFYVFFGINLIVFFNLWRRG